MRLVGAGGAEQSCFLEVHRGLQLEQDDVVDATLVAKLGDRAALVFEHAKAHLANQIAAFFRVVASGVVVAGPHQRSVFLVLRVQPVLQVLVDADLGGDQRQRVQGGLGTVAARKTQFVGVGLVFGNACPADDGGQGAALDNHGCQNDKRHHEDDQVAIREGRAAVGGQRDR